MGAAAMAFTLWTRFLKYNPKDPNWFDRDRFVLSAGHGSMLLYSLLHLTGYDLPLDELKRFRQWGSKTPGHPERGHTAGVEVATGPLGQGFGNGVGMAIAEAWLAARFNRPGHRIVDHYIYAICGDGDLMEGVTQEAASLAGHLKLGKLIYLYDNNHISLAGATGLIFTEDVARRFEAYGWHTRAGGRRQRHRRHRRRDRRSAGREPALADPGAHPHRLWQPEEAGQLRRARRAAGRRRIAGHQEGAGLADHGQVFHSARGAGVFPQGRGPRCQSATQDWQSRFEAYRKDFPARRPSWR